MTGLVKITNLHFKFTSIFLCAVKALNNTLFSIDTLNISAGEGVY